MILLVLVNSSEYYYFGNYLQKKTMYPKNNVSHAVRVNYMHVTWCHY